MAERTLAEIRDWPPVLPVFGQITPFPATPLYARLQKEGRLTRPKHWLDFEPFQMAHAPSRMTADQVQAEVTQAWDGAYNPEATRRALDSIATEPLAYKISHLLSRLFFRGIYFPQKGCWAWLKLLARNRKPVYLLIREVWKVGFASREERRLQLIPGNKHPSSALGAGTGHGE